MSNEFARFLEQLIEDKPIRENFGVELKPSLSWNLGTVQVKKIMKAILAFSNKTGGGKIVLGIAQDETTKEFVDTGMTDTDYESFTDGDRIYQDASNYGEPAPIVEVDRTEYKKKKYVVVNVREFDGTPVICKKDLSDNGKKIIEKGSLYMRTPKPECKKVEHENEMRQVIELAVDKEIIKFTERLSMMSSTKKESEEANDIEKFNKEIEELL